MLLFWLTGITLATALTIDNHVTVVKRDCYERLAIGHRLNPRNVYKTFEAKDLQDCQMACTHEDLDCKALSFGISVKGNTSCEASHNPVKETIDQKPIGTIIDTDFDLYIKKIECKLVIEPSPNGNQIKPVVEERPSTNKNHTDDVHHVHTLVAVSSGPNKPILHPIHDILVGELEYHPDYHRPPQPPRYGSFLPHPDEYRRPSTNDYLFDQKPEDSWNVDYKFPHKKPIVSQGHANDGKTVISIITELDDACFRRILAGKRVSRGLVRKAMGCERVEDCQMECAEEKRFVCEGFNYRLDPTGRGKGDCELLDIPLSHLDIGHDVYPDRDYDYYERDRNAAMTDCRRRPSSGYLPPAGDFYDGNRRWDDRPPPPPPPPRRPVYGRPLPPAYSDDYRSYGNRRGDFSYRETHHSHHRYESSYNQHHHYESGGNYLPPKPQSHVYDYKSYEPYLPPSPPSPKPPPPPAPLPPPRPPPEDKVIIKYYVDRNDDHWGYNDIYGYPPNNNRRNYYLPPKDDGNKNWGSYGNSYGYGSNSDKNEYNYWNQQHTNIDRFYETNQLLPPKKPSNDGYYYGVNQIQPPKVSDDKYLSSLLPAEPRLPPTYDFLKDECSLRSATGFRLHKGIVKKFYAVPNIHECELLCFKERDFLCNSYAYRYTVTLSTATDNCYLSNRNYKELDYYTDIEPDRDFDIYTMNNPNTCKQPFLVGKDNSDCFWRVRSGQRLDHKVVRDSIQVDSIIECQVECLSCTRFTCRGFSFRYGSPRIGGSIDNCQLTDWPFYELDSRIHFVPEPGYEVYERGSFGHGCEPDHFGIRGVQRKDHHVDKLCYIGFGSPARLLPQATRKAVRCETQLDCKTECSKLRQDTIFHCMSFSFSTKATGPNCLLSDIVQRDLLPEMDFIHDPHSLLFAWDNYNPECVPLRKPIHGNHIGREEQGYIYGPPQHHHNFDDFGLDTWKVYSVSGWPCKRSTTCHENREAGFWFCELEGGGKDAWDYCCRPDHQCGYSKGFSYQWCYVGPAKTQWRKCSERYYPYIHNLIDRNDQIRPKPAYLPAKPSDNPRPSYRPDRPASRPTHPPPKPTLDEYETQFEDQFLDPPKPGGFGEPRHWPVSYLHKALPPNTTDERNDKALDGNPRLAAIQNLIDVIKSNDLKNIEYQITNQSNKQDDILFVRIPLPTNFSPEKADEKEVHVNISSPIDLGDEKIDGKTVEHSQNAKTVERRGFVIKTNLSRTERKGRIERTYL